MGGQAGRRGGRQAGHALCCAVACRAGHGCWPRAAWQLLAQLKGFFALPAAAAISTCCPVSSPSAAEVHTWYPVPCTRRLDAFYELGLGGCWDLCAGVLVLQEAGGRVLDPTGKHPCAACGSGFEQTVVLRKLESSPCRAAWQSDTDGLSAHAPRASF